MKSLCPFQLLAIILAIVAGEDNNNNNNIHTINVTCEHIYRKEVCTIRGVDCQLSKPSNLNILNADATNDTTEVQIDGYCRAMPSNLFKLFPKLEKLTISTQMVAISREDLVDGSKLKEVGLARNKLTEIKAHTFDGMDKLEFIYLENNELTKVEANAFDGAINLKRLDLYYNRIDTIEDGAFNLPTLRRIDLSRNRLQTLADDVFIGCPNLRTVHLHGNELKRIGKSIDNVPQLSMVFFSNYNIKIVDFDFYAIARKPNLEWYIAQHVALVLDDPPSAANDTYNVKNLRILGNNLSYPDILHRLRNFANLETLDISQNNFTTIKDIENILEMFPKLHTLDYDGLPCKRELIERLGAKLGDRIRLGSSRAMIN